jgi:hypothetical protein
VFLAVAAFGGLTPGPQIPDAPDRGATLGDFNGDGLTDFVHAHSGSGSYFLINRGGGNFTSHDFDLPGSFARVINTLDVNGDGRSDLLSRDNPGQGPGQPRPMKTYRLFIMGEDLAYGPMIELAMEDEPYPVDVNGDGKDDLIVVEDTQDATWKVLYRTLKVLISRGDGTFIAREPFRLPGGLGAENDLRRQTGDLNHDGIMDIVMDGEQTLLILLGTSSGSYTLSTRYLPWRLFGGDIDLQDIDGDGNLDIVRSSNRRTLHVFHGDGAGGFGRLTAVPLQRTHDVVAPAHVVEGLYLDTTAAILGFGQFVASGRTEIVAAMPEGDLVVYAWENKKLREVARTETEFLIPQVFVGDYFQSGSSGVYMTARVSNGNGWSIPRVFSTTELMPAAVKGRSRAVRGFVPGPVTGLVTKPATEFDVQIRGDACMPASIDHWTLSRDGIFGFTPDGTKELAEVGDEMGVRFAATWAADRATAYLVRKGRDYVGTAYAKTECGSSRLEMTVTPR